VDTGNNLFAVALDLQTVHLYTISWRTLLPGSFSNWLMFVIEARKLRARPGNGLFGAEGTAGVTCEFRGIGAVIK
jgi:hypothetical protein